MARYPLWSVLVGQAVLALVLALQAPHATPAPRQRQVRAEASPTTTTTLPAPTTTTTSPPTFPPAPPATLPAAPLLRAPRATPAPTAPLDGDGDHDADSTDRPPATAPRPPTSRPGSVITPDAYCQAALAYLASHAAPGTVFTCAPQATDTNGIAFCAGHYGCTVVVESCTPPTSDQPSGVCTFTGHIWLDSNLPTVCTRSTMAQLLVAPADEADNSYQLRLRLEGHPYTTDAAGPVFCYR